MLFYKTQYNMFRKLNFIFFILNVKKIILKSNLVSHMLFYPLRLEITEDSEISLIMKHESVCI